MIVTCPHCKHLVFISEIACAIFRHAAFKNTMQQVPPHASKHDCDRWIAEELVYGCARPFRLMKEDINSDYKAIICDYI